MKWKKCLFDEDIPGMNLSSLFKNFYKGERRTHSTVLVGHFLYLFGGRISSEDPSLNDMWKLDLGTQISAKKSQRKIEELKWAKIEPKGIIPSPRAGTTLQEHNGLLYLFGGFDDPNYYNDFWIYDIGKDKMNFFFIEFLYRKEYLEGNSNKKQRPFSQVTTHMHLL